MVCIQQNTFRRVKTAAGKIITAVLFVLLLPLALFAQTQAYLESTQTFSGANTFAQTITASTIMVTGGGCVGVGTTAPNNLIQVKDLIGFPNSVAGTFLGYQAGNSNTNIDNTFVGYRAGYSNTSGYGNTAVGYVALSSATTGIYNVAVGEYALYANTTGNDNTATGQRALPSNTSGSYNASNGTASLFYNTTGNRNTANGVNALYNNTSGNNNTADGSHAGRYIANGSSPNQTSSNSVYLGYNTKALADGDTNEIIIGYDATGAGSNSISLGNSSITKTVLRGAVLAEQLITSSTATITGNAFSVGGAMFAVAGGSMSLNGRIVMAPVLVSSGVFTSSAAYTFPVSMQANTPYSMIVISSCTNLNQNFGLRFNNSTSNYDYMLHYANNGGHSAVGESVGYITLHYLYPFAGIAFQDRLDIWVDGSYAVDISSIGGGYSYTEGGGVYQTAGTWRGGAVPTSITLLPVSSGVCSGRWKITTDGW